MGPDFRHVLNIELTGFSKELGVLENFEFICVKLI